MKPLNLVLTFRELLLIPIKISECQDLCVTGDKIHFLPSSHFRGGLLAKCVMMSRRFSYLISIRKKLLHFCSDQQMWAWWNVKEIIMNTKQ